MLKEDKRWVNQCEEYRITPARGIRGIGLYRNEYYVDRDNNLQNHYENAYNHYVAPLEYLLNIAHNL